jgi:hypothetical protein
MAVTASLSRVWSTVANPNFQNRIAIAMYDQLITVVGESAGTTNHANRLAYATAVFQDPSSFAADMAFGVVIINSNIQSAITSDNPDTNNAAIADADIKTAVTALWDGYANMTASLAA